MTVFLRCNCSRRAGKKRTERVSKCDHKWAFSFKVDGKPLPPKMTPHRNKTDAERWASTYRENHQRRKEGRPLIPLDGDSTSTPREGATAVRLEELVARFDTWMAAELPKSAVRYAQVGRTLCTVLGADRLVHTIDPDAIEKWRSARLAQTAINGHASKKTNPKILHGRKVSRATINSDLIAVRALFRQAHAWYGNRSPFTPVLIDGRMRCPIRKYKHAGRRKEIVAMTPDEVAFAVDRLPVPFGFICRITYEVLPRISEVLKLQRAEVGIMTRLDGSRHGWMYRKLKGVEKPRKVAIPLDLAESLIALGKECPTDDPRLFRMEQKTASGLFRMHFDALGMRCSHHWFRHAGISAMLDRGDVDHQAIQELAGWTTLERLKDYGHVSKRAIAYAGDGNAALLAAARNRLKMSGAAASTHAIEGAA
jgi:integrase